jgi:hypothetical protein
MRKDNEPDLMKMKCTHFSVVYYKDNIIFQNFVDNFDPEFVSSIYVEHFVDLAIQILLQFFLVQNVHIFFQIGLQTRFAGIHLFSCLRAN